MSDRPDWGHGPNEPVRMWTEDQIRAALQAHHPTGDTQYDDTPLCSCSTKVGLPGYIDWTEDHFLDYLKEMQCQTPRLD